MKILALNSSARTGNNSKTELMLTHLVKGMRHAGAEVETINLRDKSLYWLLRLLDENTGAMCSPRRYVQRIISQMACV